MNQDELIERLKEVAEYDDNIKHCGKKGNFTHIYIHISGKEYHRKDFKYHTSFDWSIPVWSKIIKEAEKIIPSDRMVDFHIDMNDALTLNDPLQFFINLSDLIREIKKYNELSDVFKEARGVVKKEQDKYNTDKYNELLKEAKKNK